MSNALERLRENNAALDAERRLMNEALGRLGKPCNPPMAQQPGKWIFGIDLTGSREAGLKQARIATAAMFDAIKEIGRIEVKLAYYRGTNECRQTPWYSDADILCRSMMKLTCETGTTQITKLLRLVLAQQDKISGFVFIGDHLEEDENEIRDLVHLMYERNIHIFLFHECAGHDRNWSDAKPIFERMAIYTNGFYAEFMPDSGEVLRELLSTIVAFSTAGTTGVQRLAFPATTEAQDLRSHLLLSSGAR